MRVAIAARRGVAAASLVGTAAAACHCLSSPESQSDLSNATPRFSLDRDSRFNLETYRGRALHFLDTLGDLSTLLVTNEELARHKGALEDFRTSGGSTAKSADDEALWRAKKVVEATCHPETGEMIPAIVRFSAFAPANLFICAGMLRPNPTLLASAFWQWVNQSYNAGVNFANRSSCDGGGDFMSAYLAATTSAVGLVVGLQEAARRLSGGSPRVAGLVRLTVPMLAVSVSANLNLLLVRRGELSDGVPVATADGEALGSSILAAQRGLLECGATRVLWTFLLLTATPLCASSAFALLPARLASSPAACAAVELAVSFAVIWLSVPLSIAAFPQRESVLIAELEPNVRERWREVQQQQRQQNQEKEKMAAEEERDDERAAGCARAYFNRGL